MSDRQKYMEYMNQFPKEIHALSQREMFVNQLLRIGFSNDMSKEEVLINMVLMSWHNTDGYKDTLIGKAQHASPPVLYKDKDGKVTLKRLP